LIKAFRISVIALTVVRWGLRIAAIGIFLLGVSAEMWAGLLLMIAAVAFWLVCEIVGGVIAFALLDALRVRMVPKRQELLSPHDPQLPDPFAQEGLDTDRHMYWPKT